MHVSFFLKNAIFLVGFFPQIFFLTISCSKGTARNEIGERWRLSHSQQPIVHGGVAEHRCRREKAAGKNSVEKSADNHIFTEISKLNLYLIREHTFKIPGKSALPACNV